MNFYQVVFLLIIYQCCFLPTVKPLEVPKSMKSTAKKLSNLCMKETGATQELFGQAKETGELPNDNQLKCFLHCVLDKIGLIDSENIIHLDHLMEILPPDFAPIIDELHTTCGTKVGADGCETAFLTISCYIKANPLITKILFAAFFE